ncbi:MAG: hypothetical protein KME46_34090 [Brasilonema angustatum HA4187-MV1]|nr:hypothetical protein [Brasilonema angustatum HA4187-MV1]
MIERRDEQSLLAVRDRILGDLKTKYKVGSQSTKLQVAREALNKLIEELQ